MWNNLSVKDSQKKSFYWYPYQKERDSNLTEQNETTWKERKQKRLN